MTEAYIDQWLTGIADAAGARVDVWRAGDECELRCRPDGHVCTIPAVRFTQGDNLDGALEQGLRIALLEWAKHIPGLWLGSNPRPEPTLADIARQLDRLGMVVERLAHPLVTVR